MTWHRQTPLSRIVASIALAGLLGVAVVACGSSDGEGVSASRSDRSTSTSTSTSSTSTSTSSTTTEGTDTDDDPDDDAGEPSGLSSASATPVSVPARPGAIAQLVDVRVGAHDGYDRVVFEFDGPLPGYEVRYADGSVREDGSGTVVEVDGPETLTVRMTPASGVKLGPDSFEKTYDGPTRLVGPSTPVVEVVQVGDFEAQSTWALGVTGRRGFVVSSLDAPARLVIDVAD